MNDVCVGDNNFNNIAARLKDALNISESQSEEISSEFGDFEKKIIARKDRYEIKKIFDNLLYVYIGQNIREQGILDTQIPNDILSNLQSLKLILDYNWESLKNFKSFVTSEKGERISKIFIQNRLLNFDKEGVNELNPLALYCVYNDCKSRNIPDYKKYDDLGFLLKISPEFKECDEAAIKLITDNGLGVGTLNYASTRGGETRDFEFVIAKEFDIGNYITVNSVLKKDLLEIIYDSKIHYRLFDLISAVNEGDNSISISYGDNKEKILEKIKPLDDSGIINLDGNSGDNEIRFYAGNSESEKNNAISGIKDIQKRIVEKINNKIADYQPGKINGVSESIISKKMGNAEDIPDVKEFEEILASVTSNNSNYDGIKVLLGKSGNGDVYWEPGKCANGHCLVIGGSGAGKTVTLRSIAYELAKQNYPVLLIDFHGDMAPDSSVKTYKIKEGDGYYFNPLELSNKFEDLTPLRATSDFVDAIKINFSSLGIQQIDRLTELITEGYNNNNPSSNKSAGEFNFDELNNKIFNSDDGKSDGLRAYLRGMSDYKLFSGNQKISVESFLEPGISHINLNSLPENLRNLFADLLLRKLYYSLQSLGNISEGDISDKDKFRIFVIVDEAKLLVSDKQGSKAVLNKYATELRKSGLGLILASQLIGHFNEEILANMSAKIFMKAETKEQANKNARHFNVDPKALLKFKPGEAEFVLNNEYQHLKIIPMSERLKE